MSLPARDGQTMIGVCVRVRVDEPLAGQPIVSPPHTWWCQLGGHERDANKREARCGNACHVVCRQYARDNHERQLCCAPRRRLEFPPLKRALPRYAHDGHDPARVPRQRVSPSQTYIPLRGDCGHIRMPEVALRVVDHISAAACGGAS